MTTPKKTPTMRDVFERNKYDLKTSVRKSRAWYSQQVLLLTKQRHTPNSIMRSDAANFKSRIYPGSMYMYMYDPKYKETLPFYDRFPLVIPYATVEGGFMGLNLHYLPYAMRIQLLDNLMIFATNTKMDERTRIKYSWDLVAGAAKFKAAEPCIKRYLNNHVQTQFRKIHPEDWATALLLPVERFVGATKEEVWKNSRKKMK